MIYFLEADEAGNIVSTLADYDITIVPLINRVTFSDSNGKALVDASGAALSGFGHKMLDPVGIDEATFNALQGAGAEQYVLDVTTSKVVKKADTNG